MSRKTSPRSKRAKSTARPLGELFWLFSWEKQSGLKYLRALRITQNYFDQRNIDARTEVGLHNHLDSHIGTGRLMPRKAVNYLWRKLLMLQKVADCAWIQNSPTRVAFAELLNDEMEVFKEPRKRKKHRVDPSKFQKMLARIKAEVLHD